MCDVPPLLLKLMTQPSRPGNHSEPSMQPKRSRRTFWTVLYSDWLHPARCRTRIEAEDMRRRVASETTGGRGVVVRVTVARP